MRLGDGDLAAEASGGETDQDGDDEADCLPAEENDLPALLGQLKAACGTGGTVKDDVLEIRSDVDGPSPSLFRVVIHSSRKCSPPPDFRDRITAVPG